MISLLTTLLLATPGQPVIDISPQLAVRTGLPFPSNQLFPLGAGLSVVGGVQLPANFSLLGSLTFGVWGGTGETVCCDVGYVHRAMSMRVGPTARYDVPLGRSVFFVEAGPRYHLHLLVVSGTFTGAATILTHGVALDAALGWQYLVGRWLIGVRLDGSASPGMVAGGLGLAVGLRP